MSLAAENPYLEQPLRPGEVTRGGMTAFSPTRESTLGLGPPLPIPERRRATVIRVSNITLYGRRLLDILGFRARGRCSDEPPCEARTLPTPSQPSLVDSKCFWGIHGRGFAGQSLDGGTFRTNGREEATLKGQQYLARWCSRRDRPRKGTVPAKVTNCQRDVASYSCASSSA